MNVKAVLSFFTLIAVSAFLRFYQLGYSTYYGDETKTLYLDKTIPAIKFLLNQRKGPLQFLVSWFMEKVSGGYEEFWIRLPYAFAGLLAVVFMYLLIKKLFDWRAALVASAFFSISGFFVAFSRTAQYQSFLVALGLASLYFLINFFGKKHPVYMLLASVSLAFAFYAHYDAVFFAVPFCFLILLNFRNLNKKDLLVFGLLPFTLIVGTFYLPYFLGGYYGENTSGYLSRRLTGSNFEQNFSPYTFYFYNPSYIAFIPLVLGLFAFARKPEPRIALFAVWFLVPFVLFEVIFSNPGTHILNYVVPLYGAIGALFYYVSGSSVISKLVKYALYALVGVLLAYLFLVSAKTYIPRFNEGYPFKVNTASRKYHLFIYGMPYDRGWREIQDYMYDIEGVRGVYSNDNDVVAQYYLMRFAYTRPGINFLPPYFINVINSMQPEKEGIGEELVDTYTLLKEFYVDGELSAQIYKLRE